MNLLKIALCIVSTSISTEKAFSTADRIKTTLYNSMSDGRLNNLAMCSMHPKMVENINLINLCNNFALKQDILELGKNILVNKKNDFDLFGSVSECKIGLIFFSLQQNTGRDKNEVDV